MLATTLVPLSNGGSVAGITGSFRAHPTVEAAESTVILRSSRELVVL